MNLTLIHWKLILMNVYIKVLKNTLWNLIFDWKLINFILFYRKNLTNVQCAANPSPHRVISNLIHMCTLARGPLNVTFATEALVNKPIWKIICYSIQVSHKNITQCGKYSSWGTLSILGNFGQFWAILVNFGQFWEILGNFWQF